MSSTFKYMSILAPPTGGAEKITVRFRQYNVVASSFTLIITGLSGSESDIALAIMNAMNAGFLANNAQYTKIPSFSRDGYPPFTLVAVVCDHVVHVWSQVAFEMDVIPNGDASPVTILHDEGDIPIFPTVSDANLIAPSVGTGFVDINGTALTPAQIVQAIKIGSQQVIGLLGGYRVVASTYLQEVRGNYKLGFKFDEKPVLYEDRPIVRGPYFSIMTNQSDIAPIVNYDIDYEDGLCSFPNYGSYQRQPLDINNVLKMTYVAGKANVPVVCKQIAVQICSYLKYNPAVDTLKEGAYLLKLRDLEKTRLYMQQTLNQGLGKVMDKQLLFMLNDGLKQISNLGGNGYYDIQRPDYTSSTTAFTTIAAKVSMRIDRSGGPAEAEPNIPGAQYFTVGCDRFIGLLPGDVLVPNPRLNLSVPDLTLQNWDNNKGMIAFRSYRTGTLTGSVNKTLFSNVRFEMLGLSAPDPSLSAYEGSLPQDALKAIIYSRVGIKNGHRLIDSANGEVFDIEAVVGTPPVTVLYLVSGTR